MEVREATAEVETTTGTVVQAFTTGTVVQVFLLARGVARGHLEREWTRRSVMKTEVLPCWSCRGKARNRLWSAASEGFERMLKVTVLEIKSARVRLGFEVDAEVPVHRWEVWERIRAGGRPDSPAADPVAASEAGSTHWGQQGHNPT